MALNAQEFLAAIRKAADSKNDAGDLPVTEMCEKISPDEHIRADLFIKPEKEEQEEVYPYTIQKSIVLLSDVPLETENCDSDREIPPDESRGTISVSMDNSESQLPGLSQSGYDSGHFVSYAELNRTKSKKGILRVAAYIRVSTDLDDQENSYATQERYFTELLQRNREWTSAGIYSDYGISGTNKQNRIGYNRLLRHCSEGKIDRIVCKSISRFARNTSDFMTALKLLHDNHVTIIFEKENLNTEDQTSNFILTTLAAIAQEESRSI